MRLAGLVAAALSIPAAEVVFRLRTVMLVAPQDTWDLIHDRYGLEWFPVRRRLPLPPPGPEPVRPRAAETEGI